jgi:hypothetical protein
VEQTISALSPIQKTKNKKKNQKLSFSKEEGRQPKELKGSPVRWTTASRHQVRMRK